MSLPSSHLFKRLRGPTQAVILAVILIFTAPFSSASAACLNPAGNAGDIIYNGDDNLLSYCDGTNWIGVQGSGNTGYTPQGVYFNGTDTRLESADLSGISSSDKITGSLWFKSVDSYVYFLSSDRIGIAHTNSGRFVVELDNTSNTLVLQVRSSAGFLNFVDGEWYHVVFSFDLSDATQTKAHMYINDQDVTNILTWTDGETIDFGGGTFLNVAGVGSSYYETNVADMWIDFGTYMDLDDPNNRRKFSTAQGNPVYLGNDGSVPTGSAPEIFLSGNTSDWHTNKGSANGFTEAGALTNSTDSPGGTEFSLAAHYKLDETSGTAVADSSIYGNSGTWNGSAAVVSDTGKVDTAFDFDGVDDYVNIADQPSLSGGTGVDRSWSFWLKPDTVPALEYNVLTKSQSSALKDWEFAYESNQRVRFYYENGSGNDSPCACYLTSTFSPGEWNHVAATYDGSTRELSLYANGVLESTFTLTFDLPDTTGPVQIAQRSYTAGTDNFDGKVDDVRIYDRILSADEIGSLAAACKEGAMIYNNDHHVPQYCAGNDDWVAMGPVRDGIDNGLLAHWQLDETSGTVAGDGSGNLINGTFSGDTAVNSVDGKISTAWAFDGTDDNIQISNSPNFTIDGGSTYSFWINHDAAASGAQRVFTVDGLFLQLNASGYDMRLRDASNAGCIVNNGAHSLRDSEWHHVVITRAPSGLCTVYIDTIVDKTGSGANVTITPTGSLYIGSAGGFEYFTGNIDDFRIYDRALSPAEITALYELGDNNDSSLVGHWKLDDLSGTTAQDNTINNNDGTLNNFATPPAWGASGQVDGTLSFDGIDDIIVIPDNDILDTGNTVSLSAWIRTTCQADNATDNTECRIVQKGQASQSSSSYVLDIEDDTVGYQALHFCVNYNDIASAGCLYTTNGTAFNDGQWHHVAATWDSSTMSIYVDGSLNNSKSYSAGSVANNTYPVTIGGRNDGNGDDYSGFIDDLRIYNRALSATEIDALYKLGLGSCTNPVGKEGDLIYNDDVGVKALSYCDGANWQTVGKSP